MLQEMGDKLTPSDKAAVENAVEGLKKAIADNDVAAVNWAMDSLTQMQHKAAEALYKNTGAAAPARGFTRFSGIGRFVWLEAPRGSAGSPDGGDVIDAEVVDDK